MVPPVGKTCSFIMSLKVPLHSFLYCEMYESGGWTVYYHWLFLFPFLFSFLSQKEHLNPLCFFIFRFQSLFFLFLIFILGPFLKFLFVFNLVLQLYFLFIIFSIQSLFFWFLSFFLSLSVKVLLVFNFIFQSKFMVYFVFQFVFFSFFVKVLFFLI